MPKNAKPVEDFDVKRYLGTWYEIARLDYRFERNISNAVAQYRLGKKGDLIVRNSGFDNRKARWTMVKGIAKFRGNRNTAALKVSFFWPFYAGYNVVGLDEDYQYALVAGRSLDYLWILSRTPAIPEEVKEAYLRMATGIGYDTSKLIWVTHDKDNPWRQAE